MTAVGMGVAPQELAERALEASTTDEFNISPTRKGALPDTWLTASDTLILDGFVQAGGGSLKIVTLAPELPRADQVLQSEAHEQQRLIGSANQIEAVSARIGARHPRFAVAGQPQTD